MTMVNQRLADSQGAAGLSALAARAEAEIRDIVGQELARLFAGFMDLARQKIKTKKLANGAELERTLAQRRQEWLARYVEAVQGLLPLQAGADERVDDLADLRASAGLVAMAKALLLAETQYFKLVAEINARLNRIALLVELPLDLRILAPSGLYRTMLGQVEDLRWPNAGQEVLLSSFEQAVIAQLEPMYRRLIASLKGIGQEAAEKVVEAPIPRTRAPVARRDSKTWMQPPKDQLKVDDETTDMLTRLALQGDGDGDGYTDGLLATDLLALMDKRPLPGIAKEQGWVPLQRTSLAGHFLNEVKADPVVNRADDARHEDLRMPLVKSAIADASIFTDSSHPLASLIDEHMTKAAKHRLQNAEESSQMMDSLNESLSLFDLAPDFVRESMASARPLQDEQIQRFYELQREQAEQRRAFVVDEARRIVAEEIERSSFARPLPPSAKRFLDRVWAALLTQRLLRFGASDARWSQAIDKMDRLIDLLEARRPKQPPGPEWLELIKSMWADLAAAGLPVDQKMPVLKMLEAARTYN